MGTLGVIDYKPLFGFEAAEISAGEVNFRNEALASRVGAKVGIGEAGQPPRIEPAKR